MNPGQFSPENQPANRHPLTPEEKAKGNEGQRQSQAVSREIKKLWESEGAEIARSIVDEVKAGNAKMAAIAFDRVEGPVKLLIEQTNREEPAFNLSKLSVQDRETMLRLMERAAPDAPDTAPAEG